MEGAAPTLLSRFWVQDLVRDAGYGPLSIGDTIRTLPYRIGLALPSLVKQEKKKGKFYFVIYIAGFFLIFFVL